MSTPRQTKAAIKTAENIRNKKPKNIGVVLIESGYSIPVSKRPSTVTHSKGYQEALAPLLLKHNITVDRYLHNIDEAMGATKIVTSHTEPDYEVPDYTTRLSANKQAEKLLPLNRDKDDPIDNTEITEALDSGMEVEELQRIVFRKKT